MYLWRYSSTHKCLLPGFKYNRGIAACGKPNIPHEGVKAAKGTCRFTHMFLAATSLSLSKRSCAINRYTDSISCTRALKPALGDPCMAHLQENVSSQFYLVLALLDFNFSKTKRVFIVVVGVALRRKTTFHRFDLVKECISSAHM